MKPTHSAKIGSLIIAALLLSMPACQKQSNPPFLISQQIPDQSEFCIKYGCKKINEVSTKTEVGSLTNYAYSLSKLPNTTLNFYKTSSGSGANLYFSNTYDDYQDSQKEALNFLIRSSIGEDDNFILINYCRTILELTTLYKKIYLSGKSYVTNGKTYDVYCVKGRDAAGRVPPATSVAIVSRQLSVSAAVQNSLLLKAPAANPQAPSELPLDTLSCLS
jgi:hypothetical protein